MRCPACETSNHPGVDECENCLTPLTAYDAPIPQGPVETGLLTEPVSVLEPRPPVTVPVSARLGEAIRQMMELRVGAVLVTSPQGELVGILTERDFLAKVAGVPGYDRLLVTEYMTPYPETVRSTDVLALALGKMDAGGYRHLPVVDSGKPVGVISIRDLLRYVTALGAEV